jgi:hypothetical protein
VSGDPLEALFGVMNDRQGRYPDTAEGRWRKATDDAARKLCADAGSHQYQVVGALKPKQIRCRRCPNTWRVP